MFRSRLHRFLLASVVVLGIISFFMGRYVVSWRPVQLTEQEFKDLPPALKQHEWYSADHKWAADLIDGSTEQNSPPLKVWTLVTGHSTVTSLASWGPNSSLNLVAFSNLAVAANVNACGEDSCGDYVFIYDLQSRRKFDVNLPKLKEKEGEEVKHLQFSPDTRCLFVLTTHALYICDAHTGHFVKKSRVGEGVGESTLTLDGHSYIEFRNHKLSQWDVQQQRLIHRFSQLPSISVKSTDIEDTPYSPNGHIFYYHVHPKTSVSFYYFVDTFSGHVLWTDEAVPTFSPDGKECFAVKSDVIEVRDTSTGRIIRKLPKAPADFYYLSSDGNTLFSATYEERRKKQQAWKQRAR